MRRRTKLLLLVLACCLASLSLSASGILSALDQLALKSVSAFAPPPAGARICGVVSSYVPAVGASAGSIRIGNLTYVIAPGASIKGVVVGADQCFSFCFDDSGRIAKQDGDPTAGQNIPQICGIVTAFSPSLGGVSGSVTIGGAKIRMAPGIGFPGQNQVAPGANMCLYTVAFNDLVSSGSYFYQNQSPKQVRIPQIVHGTTFGPDGTDDTFLLPDPMILTLDSDQASVFTVNPQTFGLQTHPQGPKIEGFSYATPNSTMQAVSCSDSLWDGEMYLASNGYTDGDMVTLNLLNPDKTIAQQLAMFTISGGGATLTKMHADVKMNYNGMPTQGVGHFSRFMIWASNAGFRTLPLTFVLSTSSKAFSGCHQFAVEIKRSSGVGSVSVVLNSVTVKRMEQGSDRIANVNVGMFTGALGWYPTGRVCDFVCWPCNVLPPPPQQTGNLSGYVYCDSNDNGIKESGEGGLANVEIILLNSAGMPIGSPAKTDANGFYSFSVAPGTYQLKEIQPTSSTVMADGKDKEGTCGGVIGNDIITNIFVPANGSCTNYNFGEKCVSTKCDTICWRTTQHWINNSRYLPGGTVLISGVNANNPVGIQQNLPAVRQALQGGSSAMQRINKEYVTAQLSLAANGGSGSPVVFNVFWSALSCSGVSFTPVTLSNGVTLAPSSLLDTLNTQTVLAIKENRHADMFLLADIWTQVNGRCGQ